MKFTKSLMEEIEKYKEKENFETVIEKIRQAESVGIWGTGLAGTMICDALHRLGIEVQFFLDNNRERIGLNFRGGVVKNITEIPLGALIIIAANVKYGIHKQLENTSIKNYIYIDPVYLHLWNENIEIAELINQSSEPIDDVYNMLADDYSRKTYKNVLLHRAVHDLELIWEVYDEHQYFGNKIVKQASGSFVDCGAFQGDTLKSFLNQIGSYKYQYYAFEADSRNYEMLKEYCLEHSLENVYPINLGVWDKKEQLYFQSDDVTGDVAGKLVIDKESENASQISADSIDAILGDKHIDFIKMDIEGAEIKALNGAKESIGRWNPTLAISAYHELEHLWEVPLLIKKLNERYKICFGHHMWNMADTVCYGLMK